MPHWSTTVPRGRKPPSTPGPTPAAAPSPRLTPRTTPRTTAPPSSRATAKSPHISSFSTSSTPITCPYDYYVSLSCLYIKPHVLSSAVHDAARRGCDDSAEDASVYAQRISLPSSHQNLDSNEGDVVVAPKTSYIRRHPKNLPPALLLKQQQKQQQQQQQQLLSDHPTAGGAGVDGDVSSPENPAANPTVSCGPTAAVPESDIVVPLESVTISPSASSTTPSLATTTTTSTTAVPSPSLSFCRSPTLSSIRPSREMSGNSSIPPPVEGSTAAPPAPKPVLLDIACVAVHTSTLNIVDSFHRTMTAVAKPDMHSLASSLRQLLPQGEENDCPPPSPAMQSIAASHTSMLNPPLPRSTLSPTPSMTLLRDSTHSTTSGASLLSAAATVGEGTDGDVQQEPVALATVQTLQAQTQAQVQQSQAPQAQAQAQPTKVYTAQDIADFQHMVLGNVPIETNPDARRPVPNTKPAVIPFFTSHDENTLASHTFVSVYNELRTFLDNLPPIEIDASSIGDESSLSGGGDRSQRQRRYRKPRVCVVTFNDLDLHSVLPLQLIYSNQQLAFSSQQNQTNPSTDGPCIGTENDTHASTIVSTEKDTTPVLTLHPILAKWIGLRRWLSGLWHCDLPSVLHGMKRLHIAEKHHSFNPITAMQHATSIADIIIALLQYLVQHNPVALQQLKPRRGIANTGGKLRIDDVNTQYSSNGIQSQRVEGTTLSPSVSSAAVIGAADGDGIDEVSFRYSGGGGDDDTTSLYCSNLSFSSIPCSQKRHNVGDDGVDDDDNDDDSNILPRELSFNLSYAPTVAESTNLDGDSASHATSTSYRDGSMTPVIGHRHNRLSRYDTPQKNNHRQSHNVVMVDQDQNTLHGNVTPSLSRKQQHKQSLKQQQKQQQQQQQKQQQVEQLPTVVTNSTLNETHLCDNTTMSNNPIVHSSRTKPTKPSNQKQLPSNQKSTKNTSTKHNNNNNNYYIPQRFTLYQDPDRNPLKEHRWDIRHVEWQDDKQKILVSKSLSTILRHTADSLNIPISTTGYISIDDILKSKPFSRWPKMSFEFILNLVETSDKQRYSVCYGIPICDNDNTTLQTTSPSAAKNGNGTTTTTAEEETTTVQTDGIERDESKPPHIDQQSLKMYICANQGHSLKNLSPELTFLTIETIPPDLQAIHGTTNNAWDLIQQCGYLSPMTRQHIHFAQGLPQSDNKNVISGMRNSSSILLYLDIIKCLKDDINIAVSKNGVILTAGLEPQRKLPLKYIEKVIRRSSGEILWSNDQ